MASTPRYFSLTLVAFCAALATMLASPAAQAGPVWAQYDLLAGDLDNNYVGQASGTKATVSFSSQSVTNMGSEARHLGMYFGWSWVRPEANGAYQSMPWSNAGQAFTTGSLSLTVARTDAATLMLRPGDVQGDTWVGNPWTPDPLKYTAIATAADWELPLFDFGVMGAGQTAFYNVSFTFDGFADTASAQRFLDTGGFASYAQGVATVPEPGSVALVGLALGLMALARPGRSRRQPRIA
nr:PEP-CTERM sorting domain-containing protein [uncultured Roseateles sp.]